MPRKKSKNKKGSNVSRNISAPTSSPIREVIGASPENLSSSTSSTHEQLERTIEEGTRFDLHEEGGARFDPHEEGSGFDPHKEVDELAKEIQETLKSESSKAIIPFAKKQPKGTFGKKINLIANYFKLNYENFSVFHYDIEVETLKRIKKNGKSLHEEGRTAKEAVHSGIARVQHQQTRRPGKELCRKIIWQLFRKEPFHSQSYKYVYDGQKNLYTIKKLPIKNIKTGDKHHVALEFDTELPNFQVTIKPAKDNKSIMIDKSFKELGCYNDDKCQDSIMVLDTIMCHRNPENREFPPGNINLFFSQVQVGRSFFLLNTGKTNIEHGLQLWYGYNQSVRPTESGPVAVVNFAAKPFLKEQNALDYASDVLERDITKILSLNPSQIVQLSDAFSKVKVTVTHMTYPRRYIIKGVTQASVEMQKIDIDEKQMSVADYFKKQYPRTKLIFTHLPCLQTKTNAFLPMEVCKITANQPKLGNISPKATKSMIEKTALTPKERFEKILESGNLITNISGSSMDEFGISMSLDFMRLQGRVLDAPKLLYNPTASRFPVTPDNCGRWRIDQNKFIKSNQIGNFSWILLSFDKRCDRGTLNDFADKLCETAHSLGMNMYMQNLQKIEIFGTETSVINRALKYAKETGATLAVIILPGIDKIASQCYEEIKSFAEPKLKLLTQCVKAKTVEGAMKDYKSPRIQLGQQKLSNILNKINMKLGGINHKLSQPPVIFGTPFVVFGADAVHSPRGSNRPSIASIVGSLDAYAARYATTSRIQYPEGENKMSQEIILELNDMVQDILKAFKDSNSNTLKSKRVERILFFRDGVSEGQFEKVLQSELPLIQQACKEILGYIPLITLIIIQKKHQTRLRPQKLEDGIGRGKNIPPGTTVDTNIVHPGYFDFFLCSHEGIQGTSKPAHYIVLHDDSHFSSDELQKLCFYLCHLYVNCNRSISIPAPVQYADLACTRAKIYVDQYLNELNRNRGSLKDDEKPKLPQEIVDKVLQMKDCSSMYFI